MEQLTELHRQIRRCVRGGLRRTNVSPKTSVKDGGAVGPRGRGAIRAQLEAERAYEENPKPSRQLSIGRLQMKQLTELRRQTRCCV